MRDFSQKLREKDLILVLFLLGGFAIVVFLMIVIISIKEVVLSPSDPGVSPSPTVTTKPSSATPANLEEDYSRLNRVVPGKSTLNDLLRINGKPQSVSTKNDKTYLYYKTPLEGFQNLVSLKDNKVDYVIENVFGSYRGDVASFKTKYGDPDLILYDNNTLYPWFIYLKGGVAIENDKRDIGRIMYFVPKDKNNFMTTIAKELKMLENPPDVE